MLEIRRREEKVILAMAALLALMEDNKPNDRSAEDRRWAVAITELEKAYAYFFSFALHKEQISVPELERTANR